jgi:homoserine kinase
MSTVRVRVPATTANIGPGFDSFGLALSLWNEAEFSLNKNGTLFDIAGEGAETLPTCEENMIYQAFAYLYKHLSKELPPRLSIKCANDIPICAGLGSSASAILLGLLGANALLGNPLSEEDLLRLGCEIEGHPDNIVSAYWGGMTISVDLKDRLLTHKLEISKWHVVVILPDTPLPTKESRKALPEVVSVQDAVYNIGRSTLVAEALRIGDENLLVESMEDRIHHPYRLPLIPGSKQAIRAAQECGAPSALSGAGPSVVAFTRSNKRAEKVIEAMKAAFKSEGLPVRSFVLSPLPRGAEVCVM